VLVATAFLYLYLEYALRKVLSQKWPKHTGPTRSKCMSNNHLHSYCILSPPLTSCQVLNLNRSHKRKTTPIAFRYGARPSMWRKRRQNYLQSAEDRRRKKGVSKLRHVGCTARTYKEYRFHLLRAWPRHKPRSMLAQFNQPTSHTTGKPFKLECLVRSRRRPRIF